MSDTALKRRLSSVAYHWTFISLKMYIKRNPTQPSFKPGLRGLSHMWNKDEIQISWHLSHLSQRRFHFLKPEILLGKKHNKFVHSLRDLAAKFECQYFGLIIHRKCGPPHCQRHPVVALLGPYLVWALSNSKSFLDSRFDIRQPILCSHFSTNWFFHTMHRKGDGRRRLY